MTNANRISVAICKFSLLEERHCVSETKKVPVPFWEPKTLLKHNISLLKTFLFLTWLQYSGSWRENDAIYSKYEKFLPSSFSTAVPNGETFSRRGLKVPKNLLLQTLTLEETKIRNKYVVLHLWIRQCLIHRNNSSNWRGLLTKM